MSTIKMSPKAAALVSTANFTAYDSIHPAAAAHFATVDRPIPAKIEIELTENQEWALAQWCAAFVADKAQDSGSKSSIRGVLRKIDPDLELRNCEPPNGALVSTDGPANAAGTSDSTAEKTPDAATAVAEAKKPTKKVKKEPKPALVPVSPAANAPIAALLAEPDYRASRMTIARLQACFNACTPVIVNPETGDGQPSHIEATAEHLKNVDPTEVVWVLTWGALVATMDGLVVAEKAAGNPKSSPITAWYTRAAGHWRSGIGAKTAKSCGFACSVRVTKGKATVMFRQLPPVEPVADDTAAVVAVADGPTAIVTSIAPDASEPPTGGDDAAAAFATANAADDAAVAVG